MTPKIVGVVAVSLASAAVAVVLILNRARPQVHEPATQGGDTLDRMVVDYAYVALEQLAKESVTACGIELVGKEVDVTAHFRVESQVLQFTKLTPSKSPLSGEQFGCVAKTVEGAKREPGKDGIKLKFPEGSEYELDATLAFVSPTLDYIK